MKARYTESDFIKAASLGFSHVITCDFDTDKHRSDTIVSKFKTFDSALQYLSKKCYPSNFYSVRVL